MISKDISSMEKKPLMRSFTQGESSFGTMPKRKVRTITPRGAAKKIRKQSPTSNSVTDRTVSRCRRIGQCRNVQEKSQNNHSKKKDAFCITNEPKEISTDITTRSDQPTGQCHDARQQPRMELRNKSCQMNWLLLRRRVGKSTF